MIPSIADGGGSGVEMRHRKRLCRQTHELSPHRCSSAICWLASGGSATWRGEAIASETASVVLRPLSNPAGKRLGGPQSLRSGYWIPISLCCMMMRQRSISATADHKVALYQRLLSLLERCLSVNFAVRRPMTSMSIIRLRALEPPQFRIR